MEENQHRIKIREYKEASKPWKAIKITMKLKISMK